VEEQIVVIFAATQGFLDSIDVERVKAFNEDLIDTFRSEHADILNDIRETKELSDETDAKLRAALESFVKGFQPDHEDLGLPAAAES